ncbi:3'(2'),5'-bisphosphate nucleotidase CysQ [Lentzea guizhouensis]|uniref:3'(2'),5'-bisphosphate nucleotidase CysQ n=1 Tax=Lentzea guizhouensis TaxID=1586287 RepID=A0A1B2HCE4_9PSEU|nr:3'(2'),5'-bisphosphate nucleotidase CysQ [Lentzea guizhouensis]ANZ35382.1 3'(2'),5'-bisphosphate nucleotidase CysQ [Lentzea guizhouensis]
MASDVELAAELATSSGQLLQELRRGPLRGKELGKAGDEQSHELLVKALAEARPADAVLSEEGDDDLGRLDADRVWIVDPLDGTREYGQLDHADWAVHVALWQRGRGITDAAVAQPALDAVYTSSGTTAADPSGPLRIVVSASRPPEFASAVSDALGAELVPMGSAGAKAMAVVRGEADVYLHAGGQWEWDSAAPVGVAVAAGLHASRIDGSPLEYNQPKPYLPDLLICTPRHAEAVLSAVRTAIGG